MHTLNLIFLLGMMGILGSTIVPPILAWAIFSLRKKSGRFNRSGRSESTNLTVDVMIPAHNEAELISETLKSVADASEQFARLGGKTTLYVGLDHCMDATDNEIVRFIYDECVDVHCVKNEGLPGKWSMLQELVKRGSSEWVAWVDAGAIWDQKLLRAAVLHFSNPLTIGVAPSYGALNASPVERMNWFVERTLKQIESKAGGPISVHGATVFYKRVYLMKALEELKDAHWLNDDVVLPLTLRTLFPEHQIAYMPHSTLGSAWVTDHGVSSDLDSDMRRRKRMIAGNLQWIRTHFLKSFHSDFCVGLIASRRVFRLLWAYVALALLIGGAAEAFALHSHLFMAAECVASIILIAGIYKMRSAFWSGLQVPLHLIKTKSTSLEKIWN